LALRRETGNHSTVFNSLKMPPSGRFGILARALLLATLGAGACWVGTVSSGENPGEKKFSPAEIPASAPAEAPAPNDPGSADKHAAEQRFKSGVSAFGLGKWEDAAAEFRQALEKDPAHLGAIIHLGWVAQRVGDWPAMETHMREALRTGLRAVDNALLWMGLGFATLEQEKWETATAAFAQVVSLEPNNARARRFLALTLGRRGWFQAAEEEMRRALQLEPDDAGAHFNLAVFYLQRQPVAIELARRHYYRAIELGSAPDPQVEAQVRGTPDKDTPENLPAKKNKR
jgi:Tfp pilus assembly protein PilF